MRSGMIWLLASAAALCTAVACSEDDDSPVMTTGLPNQPGAAGSSSSGTPGPAPVNTPAPSGNNGSETPGVTQQMPGGMNGAVSAGTVDAGADDAGAVADAGASEPVADAAPPPGNPPPGNPPSPPDPPPAEAVGFSDVFPILVAACGNCHGANAPGNRPRFAQAGDEAASLTASLAMSQGTTVAQRIIVRGVTQRNMPPACGGGALGTGACLDQAEADLLQAWVDQGLQP